MNCNLWMYKRKLLGKVFVTLLELHLSISALFSFSVLGALSTWIKPQTTADAEQIRVLVTVPQWQAAHCSSLSGLSLGHSESTSTGVQTEKRH